MLLTATSYSQMVEICSSGTPRISLEIKHPDADPGLELLLVLLHHYLLGITGGRTNTFDLGRSSAGVSITRNFSIIKLLFYKKLLYFIKKLLFLGLFYKELGQAWLQTQKVEITS